MIPIDGVRALAACHGYEEVQFNETSRVIAFTKSDPNNKTRVNVYYTTGTVTPTVARLSYSVVSKPSRVWESCSRILASTRVAAITSAVARP